MLPCASVRLYWTFNALPELNHLSKDDRRKVLRRARATPVWIGLWIRSALMALLAGALIVFILQNAAASDATTISLTCSSVVVLAAAFFQIQFILQRAAMRNEIMRLLRGQRVPVCLECGYDQSDNTTDRCPECGSTTRVPNPGS